MKIKSLATVLLLFVGSLVSLSTQAGLNFAWLTAAPANVGATIDLGNGDVNEKLNSIVYTITAEISGDPDIRIDSIEITPDPNAVAEYSGTCGPGKILGHLESCTIMFSVTAERAISYSEKVKIGCSPVQAIGTTTINCASAGTYNLYNLIARFFASNPVPSMGSESMTLMFLLMLATGAWFGFRKN